MFGKLAGKIGKNFLGNLSKNEQQEGDALGQATGVAKKLSYVAMLAPILFPFILIVLVIMIFFNQTQGMEGIANVGSAGCQRRSEEKWAEFFNSEAEGTSFYNKINDLVEDNPGIDINLVSAILTFHSDISVEKDYKCNLGKVDEETGEIIKEECVETNKGSSENTRELYNEAKTIVAGMMSNGSVKSDEEIKSWLQNSYLEGRLRRLNYDLPSDEENKKDIISRKVEEIYFTKDLYEEMVCKSENNSCTYVGSAEDVTIEQLKKEASGNWKKCAELIGPIAQSYASGTGVLPSVVIAQAIEETGCGTNSPIAEEGNTLYNIIAVGSSNDYWDGEYVLASNGNKWRKYSSVSKSIGDQVRLLSQESQYKNVSSKKTPKEQIYAIQEGGYCAGCPGYEDRILQIIKDNDLEKYDIAYSDSDCTLDTTDLAAGSFHKKIAYFNQTEEPYGSKPYGEYGTIRSHGCGPTSMAIIISSMLQQNHDPVEMTNLTCELGMCTSAGSSHRIAPVLAEKFGLKSSGEVSLGSDGQKEVLDALSSGKSLVLSLQGPGIFTTGGHYIVLTGVTDDKKIQVADPASRTKTKTPFSFSDIMRSQQKWWIITEP